MSADTDVRAALVVGGPGRKFLETFVLPLVAGGDLHVGPPLHERDLVEIARAADTASDVAMAIEDARTSVTATWVVRPPQVFLDEEQLAMCVGLHNALFLAHPRADRWTVSERLRRRIAASALAMVAQPLTTARNRLLARHGLFHNLFALRRTDTRVSWWTGSRMFRGQAAPPRLTAWRGMRRVREERSTADFDDLLATPDAAPVIAALARRTPLTQLVSDHPGAPAVHWEDAAHVLRDVELARALAYQVLGGGSVSDLIDGASRLAAAFEQMIERTPREPDVRAVAAFLVHVHALFLLGEAVQPHEPSALITAALADRGGGGRARGVTTFFALPAALATIVPAIACPPALSEDPLWTARQRQIARSVGDGAIEPIANRLRRHLRPDDAAPVRDIEKVP